MLLRDIEQKGLMEITVERKEREGEREKKRGEQKKEKGRK